METLNTTATVNFDLNSYCRVVLSKMNNHFTSYEFHKYLNKIKKIKDTNQTDKVFVFLAQNAQRTGRSSWLKRNFETKSTIDIFTNKNNENKDNEIKNTDTKDPMNQITKCIEYLKSQGYKVMKQKLDWTEC